MYLQAFLRMVLSDTFDGDVSHYIVIVAAVVIACFAWWSTATAEHPHIRTVFLLEGRLRRLNTARSRLTTHIESASIVENTQAEVDSSSQEAASATNTTSMESNKPPEAGTSRTASCSESTTTAEEEDRNRIVEIMDADVNIFRQRRLDFYQNNQNNEHDDVPDSTTEQAVGAASTIGDSATAEEPPVMEHNYAERETVKLPAKENDPEPADKESNIRIKLKYLNDDLKLVDGRLEELLGDFKRRHFEVELSDNKIVRLIFNGQVLHSDAQTLQSCGFFNNCVVHCLVHQHRGTFSENNTTHSGESAGAREPTGLPRTPNNNAPGRDWDLGNLLFLCTSLILISAWYFRYEYSHLYTITATVALVAITGIFTIFLVGMYFPDHGQQPQPQQAQPAES